MPGYQLYGLSLASSETLEALLPSPSGEVDVHLHWPSGERPPAAIRWDGPPGPPSSDTPTTFQSRGQHPDGTFVRLRFTGPGGHAEFTVDPSATHVWIRWTEGAPVAEIRTLLVSTVMGHVLRLRGVLCLHASAVAVGDGAIGLLGPPGAGKSTLAAALVAEGHPLLTDDTTPLHELGADFVVPPGQARMRLRPDSANAVYGSTAGLAEVGLRTDKYFVDLSGDETAHAWRLAPRPVPLRALYLVDRIKGGTPMTIESLSPARGVGAVLAHAHARLDADESAMRGELERLGRLAARVPIRRLGMPDDLSRLPDVGRSLLADALELLGGS